MKENKTSGGPALKSVHLGNLPQDISESHLVSALSELNKAIADIGYPNAGYRVWKIQGDGDVEYKYLWEGNWPSRAVYDKIHENDAYKNVGKPNLAMFEKLMESQKYLRYSEVSKNERIQ